jgi:O-antigen/teichoic acid export membrane protein
MAINLTKRDIVWSYLGFALSYGINILLLPVVLRLLDTQELGLWFTFLGINQFMMLLDFGFMPAVLRNVSFCWGGAISLVKEGVGPNHPSGHPNIPLLSSVIAAARRQYSVIGLLALAILVAAGFPYLRVVASDMPIVQVNAAWAVFSVGIMLNIRYAYWLPLLRGIGAIEESNKAMVLARCCQLAVSLVGLWLGGGLMAVAAGFLCGGLSMRMLAQFYFRRRGSVGILAAKRSFRHPPEQLRETSAVLWHSAKRQGLISLANGMLQQSDVLICSWCLGLTATAAYGVTKQLFTLVTSCSAILFNTYLPLLNQAGLRGCQETSRQLFSRSLLVAWGLLALGAFGIAFIGPGLLNLLDAGKTMLPRSACLFMGLVLALEVNHGLFYALLTTRNRIPSPIGYVFSGFVQVALSVALVAYFGLGYWGLLTGRFLAQLMYNSWRWPQLGLRELAVGPWGMVSLSFGHIRSSFKREPLPRQRT